MAILDGVTGLEVYVEVEGKRAEEYWDPADMSTTRKACRRFIEGVPGKSFSVRARWSNKFTPRSYSLRAKLHIDGIFQESGIVGPKWLKEDGYGCVLFFDGFTRKMPNGDETLAPFMFQQLNVVEEHIDRDESARLKRELLDLGSVAWTCEAVRTSVTSERPSESATELPRHHGDREVPAKVAEALNLQQSVGFGPATIVNRTGTSKKSAKAKPYRAFTSVPLRRRTKSFSKLYILLQISDLEPPPQIPKRARDMTKQELKAELNEPCVRDDATPSLFEAETLIDDESNPDATSAIKLEEQASYSVRGSPEFDAVAFLQEASRSAAGSFQGEPSMDDELNTRSTTANHSRSNTSTQDDVIDATMFKVDPDSDDNDLDDMDDIIDIIDMDDNDATPIPVSELEAANAKLRHQAATLQHQELVAQVKQLRAQKLRRQRAAHEKRRRELRSKNVIDLTDY